QAIDLAATLALPLLDEGGSLVERPTEDGRQIRVVPDLAPDIASDPAEVGPECAQALARPFELLGVSIALVTDQCPFADPNVGLAQLEPHFLRQSDQPTARPADQLGVGRGNHGLPLNQ